MALFLIFSKSRKGYVELPSPCAEDKAEISDLGSSIRSASSRQSVKRYLCSLTCMLNPLRGVK